MTVKIIAITKSLIPNQDHLGNLNIEQFLAYVTRVSNPTNQNNSLTASKLLKYLVKNKHWSPFEMVHIVQEINTTRDIGRQILRHRSFSFQEFSQRYADPTQIGFQVRETRLQDNKNRQNSLDAEDYVLKEDWERIQNFFIENAEKYYKWAMDHNIAKEQARCILPEGLTLSRLYMSGSLRSWIHYCELRMKEGTQKEHRLIAKKAWNNILEHFPSLNELFMGENENENENERKQSDK